MPDVSALVGTTVTRMILDEYQVALMMVDDLRTSPVRALLTIEASFVYETPSGSFELDPQRVETLDQVWRFLGRHVVEADCNSVEAPILSLSFDDGSHFVIQPIPKYEAFNLTGEGVPGLLAGPA